MDIENFTCRCVVKVGENLISIPLVGGGGDKVEYSMDVYGIWDGGDRDEIFECWNPRVILNRGVLSITNDRTCAELEEVLSVEYSFPKP